MKIHFENVRALWINNPRERDDAHVNNLASSIAKYGLFQPIVVFRRGKVDGVMQYDVSAGFHRHAAIEKLASMTDDAVRDLGTTYADDGTPLPGRTFEDIFPEGMLDYSVIEPSASAASSVVENMCRKDMTQPEICALVWNLAEAGVDQHEIAAKCNMNQGRVSEYLQMRKCVPAAHDAWGEGRIAKREMTALAALPEHQQHIHLERLLKAGKPEADADAPAKSQRAVRKDLQSAAKDTRRTYANAGKPSRKRLSVLAKRVSDAAKEGPEASKNFWHLVHIAFAFFDGKIDEKAFAREAMNYGAVDVFKDPEPAPKPKATKPKATKPKAEPKPKAAKPKAEPKPKAAKPKAEPKPKATKPEATKPEAAKPKAAKPKAEPKPKAAKPKAKK